MAFTEHRRNQITKELLTIFPESKPKVTTDKGSDWITIHVKTLSSIQIQHLAALTHELTNELSISRSGTGLKVGFAEFPF